MPCRNYCGEFDNFGSVMSVSEDLLCAFELLKVRFSFVSAYLPMWHGGSERFAPLFFWVHPHPAAARHGSTQARTRQDSTTALVQLVERLDAVLGRLDHFPSNSFAPWFLRPPHLPPKTETPRKAQTDRTLFLLLSPSQSLPRPPPPGRTPWPFFLSSFGHPDLVHPLFCIPDCSSPASFPVAGQSSFFVGFLSILYALPPSRSPPMPLLSHCPRDLLCRVRVRMVKSSKNPHPSC